MDLGSGTDGFAVDRNAGPYREGLCAHSSAGGRSAERSAVRFSFTPTDGVHELSVHRHRHPLPTRNADAVEHLARRIADEAARKPRGEFTVDTILDDPDHARVLLCYADHSGPRHTTHHVFRCPDGTVLLPIIDALRSTPAEELDADLAAMLATLRPLAPDARDDEAPAKRPWWRFWN